MTHTSARTEMIRCSTGTTNNTVGACLGEEHIPATRVSSNQARGQGRVIVDRRADHNTVRSTVLNLVDKVGNRLSDAHTGTSSIIDTSTYPSRNSTTCVKTIVHWNTPVVVVQHDLYLKNVMSREGRRDSKVRRVRPWDLGANCASLGKTLRHGWC